MRSIGALRRAVRAPSLWAARPLATPVRHASLVPDVPAEKLRNVAIIAHVDHGKTTLVDQLLRHGGLSTGQQRLMDSNDLERERGITILAKATRIQYGDHILNIVDTPGHADFGGEVERVLSMVDGVVLVVDLVEGPKTQTKFVLQKALLNPKVQPIVVINKVDRPAERQEGEVESEIFDLFCALDATEEQLDYPVFYASAKNGWCVKTFNEARANTEKVGFDCLFEAIVNQVSCPEVIDHGISETDDKMEGFSMLVSQVEVIPGLGNTATGKVYSGHIRKGEKVFCKNLDGEVVANGKVKDVTLQRGVTRVPMGVAGAGDVVSVSVSGFMPIWTWTMVSNQKVPPIACRAIDPPLISVVMSVNNSPLAGKDGKHNTLNALGERLKKEAAINVAIELQESEDRDAFMVKGRGEMQLGVLLETMRREGYEMTLSPVQVVLQEVDGQKMEPWESVMVECDQEHASNFVEKISGIGGDVQDMNSANGRSTLKFEVASQNFIGVRTWAKAMTGGTAVVASEFLELRPWQPAAPRPRNGVFVSSGSGPAQAVDLTKLQKVGNLFVPENTPVYVGMILGEITSGATAEDRDVNVCKQRSNNYESADKINIKSMYMEQAMAFLAPDEALEVTPNRVAIRKKILDANQRRIEAKNLAKGRM